MFEIAARFGVELSSFSPLGNGHINTTYLVADTKNDKYVLQRINNRVFTDIEGLMNNISLVTRFLNAQKPGSSLNFLTAQDGKAYTEFEGDFYRMYEYVPGISLENATRPEDMTTCGKAFGEFQNMLSGFDASKLSDTIPRFHDSVFRADNLEKAALEDKLGRLKDVKSEYEFYTSLRDKTDIMLKMQREGLIKTRVTHNDTKLNNVLLDSVTYEPKCVIDLDTVMPGLAANDFGDCIRSGATSAAEDERDISKVHLELNLYRAFARGFLGACGGALNATEIKTLPLGGLLMTYETGARFLTDYLSGDVYFKIAYPQHNLVRTRTQIKLIRDTLDNWETLEKIIAEEI